MEQGSGRWAIWVVVASACVAVAFAVSAVVVVLRPIDPTAPAPGEAAETTTERADPPPDSRPPGTHTVGVAGAPGAILVAEATGDVLEVFDTPRAPTPSWLLLRSDEASGHLVLHVRTPPGDDGWLEVDLAVRPNDTSGWVRRADVTLSTTAFRVEVRLGDHRLRVLQDDDVVIDAPIGIGAEAPPLPGDHYFLRELLAPDEPFGDYGPFAYGLSGYALSLVSVLGGDGRLAIHGTNQPDDLAIDGGPGSIRVTNDVIAYMAETIRPPLGTPVVIRP